MTKDTDRKIRDYIAIPFMILGLIIILIGIRIGGNWTSDTFLKYFKHINN